MYKLYMYLPYGSFWSMFHDYVKLTEDTEVLSLVGGLNPSEKILVKL